MLLFIVFATVSGAVAVQWTSSTTIPNGSLVQACVGDNISLPWDFNMTSPEQILIEWFKDKEEETILAFYFRGVFAPFRSVSPHIDFLPNAGIILPMATLSDAGYYRAELNVCGDPQTYVQGAFVHVSEAPVTIDRGLHAFILPKSIYQKTTGQWHVQIGCGTFLSLGQPSVSVKWNTPSREIINSTSYDNGIFILTLSNPMEDGEYSCFLERISPAVVCLHNQSSMNRAATVDVKGVHTQKPTSCEDVKNYDSSSGIHTLFLGDSRTLNVFCDQSTDNGGWMVIQRRQDGSVNFYRDWNQYEVGFGNMSTEFWIGLANVHHLTKSKTVKLRVDLTDFYGSTAYAVYNTFNISGADDNYRLNVGGYNGTAGNSLAYHNKMQFSTFDRDHDTYGGNCAQSFYGAWWYGGCHHSNLNSRYKSDGAFGPDGVTWYHWKSDWRSMKRVEMKIKGLTLN